MALQWDDIMHGNCPQFLKDLPCDHWEVGEGPELGTRAILCIDCGWYRIIPTEGAGAARALRDAINMLFGAEDE